MTRRHEQHSPRTPATLALAAAGIAFTPHPYEHDRAAESFGGEAAQKLGVDPERVFKTLLVDVDGTLVVAIVPVAGQLNLRALALTVGGKHVSMADPTVAERKTGYVLGGISPIGQKTTLRTVIDETVERFETVYVSGGRRGFDIELTPGDLLAATNGTTAAIARP